MSMVLCPTRTSRAWKPRYNLWYESVKGLCVKKYHSIKTVVCINTIPNRALEQAVSVQKEMKNISEAVSLVERAV